VALSFGPGDGAWWRPFNLFALLPGLPAFRAPARFALLVVLGMSVLGALGAEVVRARWGRAGTVVMWLAMPLMLSEWFVIGFVRPEPFAIPAIYRTPQAAHARAIVSLPMYRDTPGWFLEPDYLYFSTGSWPPLVNGYGRTEPAEYAHIVSLARRFPDAESAATLREAGVDTVIVHAARYPDGAQDLLRRAVTSRDYQLVAQRGSDYLYRLR
jgi:hypothetical protein